MIRLVPLKFHHLREPYLSVCRSIGFTFACLTLCGGLAVGQSGLSPSPLCRVAALPAIDDPEALSFEANVGTTDVVDTADLTPATALAVTRFQQVVTSAGGVFELKSGYRPLSYQDHLQAVWDKMLELRRNHEKGCQALRTEVGEEFARHHLMASQRPVTYSDHTRGVGFDATVIMPAGSRGKRRRVSLDRLALLVGVRRPDALHDPVHFRLVATGRVPE